jgi:hypothetical protein
MQDKELSRQRLPFCFTSPRKLRHPRTNPLDVAIGSFFLHETRPDVIERILVLRQRKDPKDTPCRGCYFYDIGKKPNCPAQLCSGENRADGCDVIFKKVLP